MLHNHCSTPLLNLHRICVNLSHFYILIQTLIKTQTHAGLPQPQAILILIVNVDVNMLDEIKNC